MQAGVLETTYGEPELSCDSDGFDNESENEVEDEREMVGGDRIKFGCKARNGRNENGWVQKSYVFTAACKSGQKKWPKLLEITKNSKNDQVFLNWPKLENDKIGQNYQNFRKMVKS